MKKASLLPFCFLISLLSRYLCETFLKKSTYPLSSYLQKLEGRLDVEIPNLQVTFAPTNVSYSIQVYKKAEKIRHQFPILVCHLSYPSVVLDGNGFEQK